MAHEQRRGNGGRTAIQVGEIIAQARIAIVCRLAQKPEFFRQSSARDKRREAESAVSGDDGRDALARLATVQGFVEESTVVVGMDVYEAGGQDTPGAIDLDLGRRIAE